MSAIRIARPRSRAARALLLVGALLALSGCVYEPGYGYGYGYGYAGPPVIVSPGWGWWGHGDGWHGGWGGWHH